MEHIGLEWVGLGCIELDEIGERMQDNREELRGERKWHRNKEFY